MTELTMTELRVADIKDPGWLWRRKMAMKGLNTTTIAPAQVSGKDLTGKWVIVSGANNGIGREAVLSFAAWGANIILACRQPPPTETHPDDVVAECKDIAKKSGHHSVFEWWEINNTDLSTIEAFAQRWLDTGRPLDILCNNAGTGHPSANMDIRLTKDGFEYIHQVNFLAHALLTMRLLPSIAKAHEPRIVCTTSCMTYFGTFDISNFNGKGVKQKDLYGNNKLYFQMWLVELQRRVLQCDHLKHITINGFHPGMVNSGIWDFTEGFSPGIIMKYIVGTLASWFALSSKQGSYAITYAATSAECGPDPKLQGVGDIGGKGGGRYFNRIWDTPNMPYVYNEAARIQVFDEVAKELKLNEKGLLGILR